MSHPDQFNFIELMLADHAAGVATGCTSLRAEARGMRSPAQGELRWVEDFIAYLIGEGDLACGD